MRCSDVVCLNSELADGECGPERAERVSERAAKRNQSVAEADTAGGSIPGAHDGTYCGCCCFVVVAAVDWRFLSLIRSFVLCCVQFFVSFCFFVSVLLTRTHTAVR